MNYNTMAFLLPIGLLVVMLLGLVGGRLLGRWSKAEITDEARSRLTAVEAAIFGLMGLMIAFTFSGAAQRYELRRQLAVDEANAIGTSYLRLDLLPSSHQAMLRDHYRRYAEVRLAVYRVLPDLEASDAQAAIASGLQQEIWAATIAALKEAPPHATVVVLPALNEMIDITTDRAIAMRTKTPALIMIVLLILGLVCALLAGYDVPGTDTRQIRFHLFAFALMMAATIYAIVDLDYPRYGLIRLDFTDQALLDVLAGMK